MPKQHILRDAAMHLTERLGDLRRTIVLEMGLEVIIHARMPSSALIPFLGTLGSPINPFKQKRGTLFNSRLLGNLACHRTHPFPWAGDKRGAGAAVVPRYCGDLGPGIRCRV